MLRTFEVTPTAEEELMAAGLSVAQVERLALFGTEQIQQLARVFERLPMAEDDASAADAQMLAFLRWRRRTSQLPT